MARAAQTLFALLAAVTTLGCTGGTPHRPTVVCLGDSITNGIVEGATGGREPRRDSAGGFPGRLTPLLPGARIVNRGIGGLTASAWLAAPDSDLGRAVWGLTRVAHWPDFTPHDPLPDTPSVAVALLAPEHPDVVIVLLGVNDLMVARQRATPEPVATLIADLTRLATQLHAIAPTVLVSTLLPNKRESDAAMTAVEDGIRTAFPDYLPLGERFSAAGGTALLADDVHPTEAGYAALATILADELQRRKLAGDG